EVIVVGVERGVRAAVARALAAIGETADIGAPDQRGERRGGGAGAKHDGAQRASAHLTAHGTTQKEPRRRVVSFDGARWERQAGRTLRALRRDRFGRDGLRAL